MGTDFKGLDVTEYNGVPIYRVSIWDRFIQKYQNNGTKLNLPHVLCLARLNSCLLELRPTNLSQIWIFGLTAKTE